MLSYSPSHSARRMSLVLYAFRHVPTLTHTSGMRTAIRMGTLRSVAALVSWLQGGERVMPKFFFAEQGRAAVWRKHCAWCEWQGTVSDLQEHVSIAHDGVNLYKGRTLHRETRGDWQCAEVGVCFFCLLSLIGVPWPCLNECPLSVDAVCRGAQQSSPLCQGGRLLCAHAHGA